MRAAGRGSICVLAYVSPCFHFVLEHAVPHKRIACRAVAHMQNFGDCVYDELRCALARRMASSSHEVAVLSEAFVSPARFPCHALVVPLVQPSTCRFASCGLVLPAQMLQRSR